MDRISIERSLRWVQQFLAHEWQLVLPIVLAFLGLPSLISTLVLTRLLTPLPETVAEMQAMVAALPAWLTPLWLACWLTMLTGGLVLTAIALLPQISVGEAIHAGVQRLASAVGAAALILAGTMLLLTIIGIAAAFAPLGQGLQVAIALIAMVAGGLLLLLLLPLIVDRRSGPVAAIRASRRFYRGNGARLAAAIILYLGVTFVAAIAIRVAIGSLLILLGTLAGLAEIGQTIVVVMTSAISAIQFGGLFLLVAAFYRQRVGRA